MSATGRDLPRNRGLARLRWDARSYLANVRPSREIKRFCIVTTFRTGSELLIDLLNSHPKIRCDGEVLTEDPPLAYLLVRGKARAAAARHYEAYGFKALAIHLMDHFSLPDPSLMQRLAADGTVFIHLQRRNILRQMVSYLKASSTQRWHARSEDDTDPPVARDDQWFEPLRWRQPLTESFTVDIPTLLFGMRAIEIQNDGLAWLIAGYPQLTMWYEDALEDAANHQATVDSVCDFIGIASHPVKTQMRKLAARSLVEDVPNYDEVASFIGSTRYAGLLD